MDIVRVAYGLWIAFLVIWWLSAFRTARARSRGVLWQRVVYFIGFAIGFGLLFTPIAALGPHAGIHMGFDGLLPAIWQAPLWPARSIVNAPLVVAELAAFAFAGWARLHLGRLWSGMLTLREGHRVVDTGPYRLVRHPIYTGFIVASWSLALIVATSATILGAVILTLVMGIKAKGEERLLRRELGPAAYDDYAMRTPMLVPWTGSRAARSIG